MTRRGSASIVGAALLLVGACGGAAEPAAAPVGPNAPAAAAPVKLAGWPPRLGQPYPDVELHDRYGNPLRMSSFRGKVLLIEPIGMNCPACNAFNGAGRDSLPGFQGTQPQQDLVPISEMLPAYAAGATLDDPDLLFIHLLLYNMRMKAPTQEDAARWAAHFGIDAPNHRVLYADERFIGPASYNMIPGFQLVDRDFVLRSDSTGHRPRNDLYSELLPLLGRMLREP